MGTPLRKQIGERSVPTSGGARRVRAPLMRGTHRRQVGSNAIPNMRSADHLKPPPLSLTRDRSTGSARSEIPAGTIAGVVEWCITSFKYYP